MTVPAELDRRFREAAAAEGLLDAAYDLVESPVGTLLVAATDRGVCRISYTPDLDALAAAVGPRLLRVPSRLAEVRRQLEEYFAGTRHEFDLPVDLHAPAFQEQVLRELALVPYGELATYGELARRIGRPRAARAVGGALNRNPVPIVLPCHRVVGATGALVGYAGGLDRKRALLALEAA
ncbi:MAG: methylated-DNA--[protein]-cysteine S-methyltransferase [Gaiellaceae bacterium]